jgi:DNA-binding NarL/FixJ family response regulator
MIVDDHAGTRKMIRDFLDLPDITFCECASGDEAVLRAREFKPDWVTMDVQMPGINGFQATEALRAEHPSVRIIIVTSFNEPYFRRLSQLAGATGFIHKENLAELLPMLVNAMSDSDQPAFVSDEPSSTTT